MMLALLLMCMVSIILTGQLLAEASPTTVLSVEPVSYIDPALVQGSLFFINITVADVQELAGYQFDLGYDTDILTAVGYGFFPPLLDGFGEIVDNEGRLWLVATYEPPNYEVITTIDPTPVCWIEFVVDGIGNSTLDLSDSLLGHPDATPIPHIEIDGFFSNSGAQMSPTASFTYTPQNPYAGETVAFDASASYDPDGTIVSYLWDFGDGINGTGMLVTHAYAMAGTYPVALTVADNDALTDTTIIAITILPMLVHDIAVTAVISGPPQVLQGETVTINVTTENKGNVTETFDVTVYYDSTAISTMTVTELAPGAAMTVVSEWNTTGVAGGDYLIKGAASPVPGETDLANNEFLDGWITVIAVGNVLSVKLSGEFDYMRAEPVSIRLAALVRDAETAEPVSNALVNVEIYDAAGKLWVSALMQEEILGSGIYEWKSEGTVGQLRLSKGVYLVRASASLQDGSVAYDIILFHIDPPSESEAPPSTPLLYYATVTALIAGAITGIALLRRRRRQQYL